MKLWHYQYGRYSKLYSYKNITGIADKKAACTYYTYSAENKKSIHDVTLDYLKNLRDKS